MQAPPGGRSGRLSIVRTYRPLRDGPLPGFLRGPAGPRGRGDRSIIEHEDAVMASLDSKNGWLRARVATRLRPRARSGEGDASRGRPWHAGIAAIPVGRLHADGVHECV